jgi:hypothetical protein
MPLNKITRVKDGSGDVHLRIKCVDGSEPDVVLTEVTKNTVDASEFGIPAVPAEATVYDVETNDPARSRRLVWDEQRKQLLLRTPERKIQTYNGGSLKACILKAYDDGALA